MQIVIDIPDTVWSKAKEYGHLDICGVELSERVMNGTPLPEGHGRIGDLDELIRAMKERNDDNGGEPLNAVDRGYDLAFQHMIKESKECVIIEADKEELGSDENSGR